MRGYAITMGNQKKMDGYIKGLINTYAKLETLWR